MLWLFEEKIEFLSEKVLFLEKKKTVKWVEIFENENKILIKNWQIAENSQLSMNWKFLVKKTAEMTQGLTRKPFKISRKLMENCNSHEENL